MLNNCYRFLDHWRLEATPAEVFRIMEDWTRMPVWWPAVVVRAEILDPGDAQGVGGLVQLHTRGILPYVIRTQVETTEKTFPHCLRTRTQGELRGEASWTFTADGPYVDMHGELTLLAEKPVLKYLSFALKPLFAWNHRWAMDRGQESIVRELAHRRAASAPTDLGEIAMPFRGPDKLISCDAAAAADAGAP